MSEPWIDELIELGIGAAATYYLGLIVDGGRVPATRCGHCGAEVKKFAVNCPRCRRRLRWTRR